ncbi:ABC transporter permease [Mycoplasmopsis gallinacea]|uniref:Oligopeptide ABC transporter permease n=1 Tax=Mycoplasmopsis gallinacea TaxID=29556 RepID=A0A449A2Z6_9BACT|nr:ABC transporter permease [Mycoplasmopsis gallinacea]VEU58582.1 oligopeptide ABC transporter permease [Mycoplasmopsis gallinacea]
MFKYLSQRILLAILTLIIIVLVVYLSVAIFAENPFVRQLTVSAGDKKALTESQIRDLFEKSKAFHLTPANLEFAEHKKDWIYFKVSPFVRLGYWFKDIFNKEYPFGNVFDQNVFSGSNAKNIPDLFFKYIKFSIIITLPSFIISAILGIALGIVAGYKRGTTFDIFVNFFSLVFIALPSFIVAPIFISILLNFNIPPIFQNPSNEEVIKAMGWGKIILSWLPPIFIIVLGSLSGYISYARNQVVTVLTSNYVLIAKSKGLSRSEIFFKYVLRNISIPLAALIIPSYIGLLSGGIVIETYWQVPGTSKVLSQAFPTGEINLIMFSTFFFTTLGLFTTILVDVVYTILDPRIKYGTTSKYNLRTWFTATLERNKQFKELNELAKGGN